MGFGSKVFQGGKDSRKQSVLGCKVCYGVKSAEEQSVPGSKMCWVAKGSMKQKGSEWQRVFRSKVCWRVNCDFAKCVGLQSVLCFWEAKCSQGVKCVLVQSVHQPPNTHYQPSHCWSTWSTPSSAMIGPKQKWEVASSSNGALWR